ncbi:hypothetical protein B0H14DRAFT_3501330 [Mycena olivaceomarginata]|nr:hypothetical protein B0H14DRAFT_3501330 [Mycena olivaceomarginata]
MRATTIGCSVSPQYEVHHRRHVHRPRRPLCIAESAFVASPRATTSLSAVPFMPSRCAPGTPPTAPLPTHVCCVALGPHNTTPLRSTTRIHGTRTWRSSSPAPLVPLLHPAHSRHDPVVQHHPYAQHAHRPLSIPAPPRLRYDKTPDLRIKATPFEYKKNKDALGLSVQARYHHIKASRT